VCISRWIIQCRIAEAHRRTIDRDGGQAAIATRFGSSPSGTRRKSELGDYEQTAPHLLNTVGHEYLILAAGAFYIFNRWDGCCFAFRRTTPFVRFLNGAPKGDCIVEAFVDVKNPQHSIGPDGYVALAKYLQRVPAPR